MTIKDSVLKALEEERGECVSGEALARRLGISRQTVSKTVRALIAEGYAISASTKRGYCLAADCDLLSPAVIAAETGARVVYLPCVSSTNSVAAAEYCRGGECLVVARAQTAGRNKEGGSFPSPENGGVYLSMAFPVSFGADEADAFRERCALAAERVLNAFSGRRVERVRLDEFLLDGKKTAGILVELMVNAAQRRAEFAVVGVGIYTGEAFSSEFAPAPLNDCRNRMIVALWREIIALGPGSGV